MESARYCSVENCHWIDNRTCAAVGQAQFFAFLDCDFIRSGQSITASEIDFEDGWEQMQDFFIMRCKDLEPIGTGDIIDCSGINHVYDGNENMSISVGYRVNGLCIRNNRGDQYIQTVGFMTGNTIRVYNNEFTRVSGSSVNYNGIYNYERNRYKIKKEQLSVKNKN